MRHLLFYILLVTSFFAGCATKPLPPVAVNIPSRPISYQKEVKPLLEKRCTVCHSCYNSPCQLKLDSFEGVDRGATKRAVYNATRLKSMDPTRLFMDALTTEEWRKKSFFSVTESSVGNGLNDSIMLQLLSHKIDNPKSVGEYQPDVDDLQCSENRSELADYLKKHPNRGMPYGFPPLKRDEFETIAGWLVQGAKGPDAAEQKMLETPGDADAAAIAYWESFLNRDEAKYAVTARYLYEHIFLAHIRFGTPGSDFFELVRSRTPPGKPLDLVATVRPFDDPGTDRVYYRFRKIYSTIVSKTHMVFDLDDAQFKRINELFIQPKWLQPPHLIGYDQKLSANPFEAFEQIPPLSRYRFLLDNAQYIIMTFIHGPVCKGQVALNVIDDHFWVMFMDPDHDLTVKYPGFLKFHNEKLRLPTEAGSDKGIFATLSDDYPKRSVEFYRARQDYYSTHNYSGLGYEAIWRGSKPADAPFLSVYRHFDSASVHRGLLGNLPKTLWVIDYPLMERIYYALVAGFDVYGTVGHQMAVRLYMDTLRVEGETNFLNFLPPSERRKIMQSWYGDIDVAKMSFYPSELPAGITFETKEPLREFVEHIVEKELPPSIGIAFDPVNYIRAGSDYPPIPKTFKTVDDYLQAFRAVSRPGTPFVSMVNDYNSNLAYIRIRRDNAKDVVISLVCNRWHDNVAFMFGEGGRLRPSKDNIEFIRGMIGSYPNYFFDLKEEELPDFIDLLATFSNTREHLVRLGKYGINRADDRFWQTFDWFQKRFNEDEPIRGGLFDLNRYHYRAKGKQGE